MINAYLIFCLFVCLFVIVYVKSVCFGCLVNITPFIFVHFIILRLTFDLHDMIPFIHFKRANSKNTRLCIHH
jgi:hypothetical protein